MHLEGTATAAVRDVARSRDHHKSNSHPLPHVGRTHILCPVNGIGSRPKRPQTVAVTGADVETWRDEVDRIAEQARQLEERRVKLVALIEAASALFNLLDEPVIVDEQGVGGDQPASGGAQEHVQEGASDQEQETDPDLNTGSNGTFVSAVRDAVYTASEGIAVWELKRTIADGPLGARLDKSDKGFHHAVSRLTGRGIIVRHNSKLFSPDGLRKFLERVAAGLSVDSEAKTPMAYSPMGEAVKKIVSDQPGIAGGELIRKLKQDPEFAAALNPHTTGAYNVIARLVSRGQISKRDREYYPASISETNS